MSLDQEVVTKVNGVAEAPKATATAIDGCEFVKWTDSSYGFEGTDASMADLPAYYDEDTTFTAYFKTAGEEPEEPQGPITVYFEARHGTFENGLTPIRSR